MKNEKRDNEGGSGGGVLVLEDHSETARLMHRLFMVAGYMPFMASTCAEARQVWARERCTLFVADLTLPDGTATELMRELRAHGVRGIAVTGHDDSQHRTVARDAGFSAHLVKPIDFNRLLEAVEHVRARLDGLEPDAVNTAAAEERIAAAAAPVSVPTVPPPPA